MARRKFDPLRRHQIEKRIMGGRHGAMHGLDHAFILLRPADRQHIGILGQNAFGLSPHAACHNDLAVFGHRLANRFQRFIAGAIEKTAGVDNHHLGPGIIGRDGIALGPQMSEDALTIHQRLGATEGNNADGRRFFSRLGGFAHDATF